MHIIPMVVVHANLACTKLLGHAQNWEVGMHKTVGKVGTKLLGHAQNWGYAQNMSYAFP
jgi:hypothetical protein